MSITSRALAGSSMLPARSGERVAATAMAAWRSSGRILTTASASSIAGSVAQHPLRFSHHRRNQCCHNGDRLLSRSLRQADPGPHIEHQFLLRRK